MSEPLLLRIPEAAKLLGVSRSKAYAMAAAGEIPTIHLGGAVRVPLEALRQFIADETRQPSRGVWMRRPA